MSRVSYKSESQGKMAQTIKLLNYQYSKFDQPDQIELKSVWKIEEHLETCKNVKLKSYKQYPFDIPQKSKKIEEIIEVPNCIGITQYKNTVCIFVLCVFCIVFGIYFYCVYRSYF